MATRHLKPHTNGHPAFLSRILCLCCVLLPLLLAGCGGGGGGGGGSTTTTTTTTDTTAPSIAFTAPAANSSYTVDALPSLVSLLYSDTGSGIATSTLRVTFTFNNFTMDITGIFTVSSASAQTASADPLARVPVVCYPNAVFSSASVVDSFPRTGSENLYAVPDNTDGRLYIWSSSARQVIAVNPATAQRALTLSLSFAPSAVFPAGAAGKVYLVNPSENYLQVYNSSSGAFIRKTPLADLPKTLAFTPDSSSRFYAGYANRSGIAVIDTSTDALLIEWATGFIPAHLIARPGASGDVVAVATTTTSLGAYRFLRYDSSGTSQQDIALDTSLPKDIDWVGSSDAYMSIFASASVTWLRLDNGATQRIPVGYAPTDLFSDASTLFAVNSGDRSVTPVSNLTHTASSDVTFTVQPLAGAYVSGASPRYCLLQNVWDLSAQTTGTLSATIRDRSGNTGTSAPLQITVSPGSAPPPRVAHH